MKIAVPTRGKVVDEHFGHCEYYTVFTIENKDVLKSEVVKSPQGCGCKSNIASVEAQADAAEATVVAQFDAYADEVEGLSAHLDWVGWMLDALETATFQLLATESGVAAVEAVWQRPGLEPVALP